MSANKLKNLNLDQYRFQQEIMIIISCFQPIIPFRLVLYSPFDTLPYDKQLFSHTSSQDSVKESKTNSSPISVVVKVLYSYLQFFKLNHCRESFWGQLFQFIIGQVTKKGKNLVNPVTRNQGYVTLSVKSTLASKYSRAQETLKLHFYI